MPARGASGFTLIELMVVLILIGIFSALMVGEMRGTYEDALLRSTARTLISGANLANSKAVTLGRAYSMFIDSQENCLKIGPQGEKESLSEERLDPRISIDVQDGNMPVDEDSERPADGQKSSSDPKVIRFQPDGTAEGRELLLRDRMGVEVRLRLNAVTGRIGVVESEGGR